MNLFLVLGNQLFDPKHLKSLDLDKKKTLFFMREDRELASYYKFHKHKIIFFFAAMRTYSEELQDNDYRVHYETFNDNKTTYEQALDEVIKKHKVEAVTYFEIEDKFFEKRLVSFFEKKKVSINTLKSPMFLTSRDDFKTYLKTHRKPFMKTFYEGQRKRFKILVDGEKPVGGAWSFDTENRLALPKTKNTPDLPKVEKTSHIKNVEKLVEATFAKHPGTARDFWLPVDRLNAKKWLQTFLKERLAEFGPYEDALAPHSVFVYHSVLTPFLNCGLLTPDDVIKETLSFAKKNEVPLGSLEGFIRQVIGWREFIRGIYQNYSEVQEKKNFWNCEKKLTSSWYKGGTGVPPLDETISRVVQRGYAHHIERLMVVGNLMLLLEVHPHEAHKWFMEMFIDSSDWVMGPNVYGMALFSDGGIFATKPYICGSNYWRKMGGYAKGDWCDGIDGLYWQFIKKHKAFFMKNPRLSMMARSFEKIPKERWALLTKAADELREKLTSN